MYSRMLLMEIDCSVRFKFFMSIFMNFRITADNYENNVRNWSSKNASWEQHVSVYHFLVCQWDLKKKISDMHD